MAKEQVQAAAPVDLAAAPAYFHPNPEEMERAGFRQSLPGVWHWYSAGEGLGGYHILVSLLPVSGEVFIHHTQGCRTEIRYEYGKPVTVGLGPTVPAIRAYCRTREVFGTLLKSYGWRMPS